MKQHIFDICKRQSGHTNKAYQNQGLQHEHML